MKKQLSSLSFLVLFSCASKALPPSLPQVPTSEDTPAKTSKPLVQNHLPRMGLHIQPGALGGKDDAHVHAHLLQAIARTLPSPVVHLSDDFSSTDQSRMSAGKKNLPSVLSVFKPSKDSEFVSATLMTVLNGRVMGETSLPKASLKSMVQHIVEWFKPLSSTVAELAPMQQVDFLKALSSENNCESFNAALENRTLSPEERTALKPDFKICKSSNAQADLRPAQVGIKSTNLSHDQKALWLKHLENSPLLEWINTEFSQNTQIFIRCEEACKEGEFEAVVSTDAAFRKGLQYDESASEKIKKLSELTLAYRSTVSQFTAVPPLPLKITLETENHHTLTFEVSGSASNPSIENLSELEAFIAIP